jgi:hypothetical protein
MSMTEKRSWITSGYWLKIDYDLMADWEQFYDIP